MNRIIGLSVAFLVVFSVIVLAIFLFKALDSGAVFWNNPLSFELSGLTGDFIGGVIGTVFSAGAFLLMYLTLHVQQTNARKDQIENRFFRLVELHRKNVEEMEFDASGQLFDPDTVSVENKIHKGKAVFHVVFKQMTACRNELLPFFKYNNDDVIYELEYYNQLKKMPFVIENKVDLNKLALIDISYGIVFFGLESEGRQVLTALYKGKYRRDFISDILDYMALKPAADEDKYKRWKYIEDRGDMKRKIAISKAIKCWRNQQEYCTEDLRIKDYERIEGFDSAFVKYYGGHQFTLGHYFRHLFQTVRFMNEQMELSYAAKYGYIKLLRAQLSNYEQAILFYNSLSLLGRDWEMTPKKNPDCCFSEDDFHLITKYNLIKNLPCGSQLGVDPRSFYPSVQYETGPTVNRSVDFH